MKTAFIFLSLAVTCATPAASELVGVTEQPSRIKEVEAAFQRRERERTATPEEAVRLQALYLESHLFGKARALAAKYPAGGLLHVPEIINESPVILENDGKYYETDETGSATLKSLDISSGTFILIYGVPGDALVEKSLGSIASDKTLAPIFTAWASLMTDKYDFRQAGIWNGGHRVKYKIMYSASDWPALSNAAGPGFNFFKDGALACYAGWKNEASLAAIKKCAAEAGLISREARLAAALRIMELRVTDNRGYSERVELFKREYDKLTAEGAFETKAFTAYGRDQLLNAYDAADYYSSYFPAGGTGVLELLFSELEKRGLADAVRVKALYGQLLDARKFTEAGLLRDKYPAFDLEDFPRLAGRKPRKGRPFVYNLSSPRNELTAEETGMRGKQIIIAAQPGCRPTQRALEEIENDKDLLKMFKAQGLLLASRSDFAGVGAWNAAHALKFRLINSAADWPGMDFENSPSFYFLDGGKVVHSFTGWPKNGNMAEFRKGLAARGN